MWVLFFQMTDVQAQNINFRLIENEMFDPNGTFGMCVCVCAVVRTFACNYLITLEGPFET